MSQENDYIFRYPVEEKEKSRQQDLLLEMIRVQLQSLLKLFSLRQKGEEVKPDGFRLMNEREVIHPIFLPEVGRDESQIESSIQVTGRPDEKLSFQSARNAELYEPRISHIKRVLESLLSVVVLESKGRPVKIDGFRLKDLNQWIVPSVGDPAEIFDHLATRCDCHCSFCYLRGNPPSLALEQPRRSSEEEFAEARTRLKYFSPQAKRALFPTLGSPYEFLSHPYALDLLTELRKKTDRPFRLSTNGNQLTPEFIQKLSALKPLYLYLSLNSSSPARRGLIMRTERPEMAIRSLPLLKESRIPFAVVIVPWPFPSIEEMIADLKGTAFSADQQDAHLIEVSLPGYSQYFSPSPLFNLEEVWSSVVSVIRSLRWEVQSPLLVKPSLYEETLYEERLNRPQIVGVVKNSPAAISGLKSEDLILSIGGLKISSRPQARDILHLHHQSRNPFVTLSVQRSEKIIEVELSANHFAYPYTPETNHHLGIIFMGAGFRAGILEDLKSLISAHGAQRVLILSSRLVRPVFEQLLRESPLLGNIQIHIEIPQNRFFGGNIFMGDLLVVQDFIEAIREFLKKHPPPDLIVIPSSPFSLGNWRRDLEGKVYSDIERAACLPVALLDCEPIYD
ncbi:MAG: radical SAM protein [Deltaproteobacteria bacterium]|nr:radical SAM protein [Deltaproteobacteria bacterium]